MANNIGCVDSNGTIHQVPPERITERRSVYGIIVRNGSILLSPEPTGYDLPWGGIDPGETEIEALVREIREETGYFAEAGELVAQRENHFFSEKRWALHSKLAYRLATVVGWELSDRYFDESEKGVLKKAEWVGLERLDEIRFSSSVDVRSVLREVLKR